MQAFKRLFRNEDGTEAGYLVELDEPAPPANRDVDIILSLLIACVGVMGFFRRLTGRANKEPE